MRKAPLPALPSTLFPLATAVLLGAGSGWLLVAHPEGLLLLGAGILLALILFLLPLALTPFLLLILLFCEGALRKWIIPQAQEWVYFGKDLLILLSGVRLLFQGKVQGLEPFRSPLLQGWFLLFLLYLASELLNPRLVSLPLFLFGVRGYLFPLLAALVLTATLEARHAELLFKLMVFALVPLALVGMVQANLPPQHPLNRYVEWVDTRIALLGMGKDTPVRVTSLFSYITGYSDYLYLVLLLLLTLFLQGKLPFPVTLFFLLLLFYQLILTGSRGAFLASGLALTFYLLYGGIGMRKAQVTPSRKLFLLVGTLAFVVLVTLLRPSGILKSFQERWETGDMGERFYRLFVLPFRVVPEAGLMGYGPGSEHQSRMALLGKTQELGALPGMIEEESARVVLELGAIGGFLWYLFWIALLARIVSTFFRYAKGGAFALATLWLPLLLFTLHLVLTGVVYKTGTAYFWSMLVAASLRLSAGRKHPSSPGAREG